MAALPEPWKSLRTALEKLAERVKRLENTSPFSGTGLSIPEAGTTQVTGNLWITGDLTAEGKINNAALTNPVVPATAHADASNFSLSTSWTTKMSVTVPVPAGYTQALILSCTAAASARNTTGADNWFYISVNIPAYGGGLPGFVISSPNIPASAYGTAIDCRTALVTGLSGSFTILGEVMTESGSWTADVGNAANLDVSMLFLR